MLLMVVRSGVPNLMSHLKYMSNFSYFYDTNTGEYGYTLSSFEAVLAFLGDVLPDLLSASNQCRRFWDVIASGDLNRVRDELSIPVCLINDI
jgi:hypothetical protein